MRRAQVIGVPPVEPRVFIVTRAGDPETARRFRDPVAALLYARKVNERRA